MPLRQRIQKLEKQIDAATSTELAEEETVKENMIYVYHSST